MSNKLVNIALGVTFVLIVLFGFVAPQMNPYTALALLFALLLVVLAVNMPRARSLVLRVVVTALLVGGLAYELGVRIFTGAAGIDILFVAITLICCALGTAYVASMTAYWQR
jgi:hypothetical protein